MQASEVENERITFGSLHYDRDKKTLTLINRNTQLPTKVLLLGYTSKRGHHDVIGQFGKLSSFLYKIYKLYMYILCILNLHVYIHVGEGLKIGTLALLRKKHKVRVATHNCSWHFSLEKHPHFDETVLTVTLEGKCILLCDLHVTGIFSNVHGLLMMFVPVFYFTNQ